MKTKIAFDVTGLAWNYRTGVQNLYWGYIDAFAKHPKYLDHCDVTFYDRSGVFNEKIAIAIPENYQSCVPSKVFRSFRRPMQMIIKAGILSPNLNTHINQVWNWDIYSPSTCKASITIPDILPIEYPQWFSARFRGKTEKAIAFAANKAQYINCISYDVRNRLASYSGINPNKIRVIYPGIDPIYFMPMIEAIQERVVKKFNLTKGGYLISSGFLDPRKNLKRQIEAFGRFIKKNNSNNLRYVLTGVKTNLSQDILRTIEDANLGDKIVFLGYVSQEDLRVLIGAAACVMYCSIAEGFGLPIIEAMALGVPVITSNSSSMHELAIGRAELAEPLDIDSIETAIQNTMAISELEKQARILSNQDFAKSFTIDRWLNEHIDHMLEI